jgi:hypothetical protein
MSAKYNPCNGENFNSDTDIDFVEVTDQDKQEAYEQLVALVQQTREQLKD